LILHLMNTPWSCQMTSQVDVLIPHQLAELQLASYHLASAPAIYSNDNTQLTPGSLSYVPRVRDQRGCSTCVGHAVASAVEAAAGAATRRAAGTWNVSPQSLYYCRWVLTQEAWPGGLPAVMCQNFLQQLTKLISARGERLATWYCCCHGMPTWYCCCHIDEVCFADLAGFCAALSNAAVLQ